MKYQKTNSLLKFSHERSTEEPRHLTQTPNTTANSFLQDFKSLLSNLYTEEDTGLISNKSELQKNKVKYPRYDDETLFFQVSRLCLHLTLFPRQNLNFKTKLLTPVSINSKTF